MQKSVPWGLENFSPCRDKKKGGTPDGVAPLYFSWLAFMISKSRTIIEVLFPNGSGSKGQLLERRQEVAL